MRAVDVGDEVCIDIRGIGLECIAGHQGAEVGATDADVDDIGNFLAGKTFPAAIAHAFTEIAHLCEYAIDVGHDILAIDVDRGVAAVAQGGMQYGTMFGEIDFFAGEHLVAHAFQIHVTCQLEQQGERLVGDAVL